MSKKCDVTLYYASGSVPSMSLMIVLEEKGVEYISKEVDPEDVGKEVKALNPREEVPVLQHGDVVLSEYLAACLYLEEVFGGNKLVPEDNVTREALVLQRTFSAQNIGVGETSICGYWEDDDEEEEDHHGEDEDSEADPDEEEEKEELAEELMLWDEYLKEEKTAYIAGEDFSMADAAFFPVLAFIVWNGLELKKTYPNLYKYYMAVRDRPTVQAVWPTDWNKPSPDKLFIDLEMYLHDE